MSWDLAVSKQIAFHVGYGASRPLREPEAFAIYWHAEGMKSAYSGTDFPAPYDRYYIRSDDEDNVMTSDQLERFFSNRSYDYSQWEHTETEYTADDIDENLLIKYVNRGNECGLEQRFR